MAGLLKKGRQPNSKARRKKAQLSFYAEPHDYAALKALSTSTGVPQQVYLRRGLAYVLKLNDGCKADDPPQSDS